MDVTRATSPRATTPPPRASSRLTPRLVTGIAILLAGIFSGLEVLDVVDDDLVAPLLPLAFVGLGAAVLAQRGSRLLAVALAAGGTWQTLANLGLLPVTIFELWPIGLIALGAILVRRSLGGERTPEEEGQVSLLAVLSHTGRVLRGTFVRGRAAAVAGGAVVDLRQAEIGSGATVTVFSLWAAVEVVLPPGCRAVGAVFPVMGAYEDTTTAEGVAVDSVRINGVSLMAGVEVRNEPSDWAAKELRRAAVGEGSR